MRSVRSTGSSVTDRTRRIAEMDAVIVTWFRNDLDRGSLSRLALQLGNAQQSAHTLDPILLVDFFATTNVGCVTGIEEESTRARYKLPGTSETQIH